MLQIGVSFCNIMGRKIPRGNQVGNAALDTERQIAEKQAKLDLPENKGDFALFHSRPILNTL